MNYTIVGLIGVLTAVRILIANALIAFGVLNDAERLASMPQREVKLFSPPIWAVVCFFGGIPALALYALLHHSTFSR
jgi:hypothetical protein